MANPRFYSPEKLSLGTILKLSESSAIHAIRVLRLNVGGQAILFNGDGIDYTCELISIKKNEVVAKVIARKTCNNESPLHITLCQGISSGDRMDYTLQKAVELGVAYIQPLFTERSIVKLSGDRVEKRVAHWQNIVISACEQCGRATIPLVFPPTTLAHWLNQNPKAENTRILLNPTGIHHLGQTPKPTANIQLLIGSEGGLTHAEIDLATTHGFQSTLLGPRILRTETAAVTAISAMQTLWGDF